MPAVGTPSHSAPSIYSLAAVYTGSGVGSTSPSAKWTTPKYSHWGTPRHFGSILVQPAVLRSIRNVITAAKEAGIPVGMCGEAAADPRLLPLLMTWGLDEFSVSASAVLSTRAAIRKWLGDEARKVTGEAMGLSTLAGVEGYLAGSTAQ